MSHEQAHSHSHEGVECAGHGDEIGVAPSDVTGECCLLNFFCVSGWMRYVWTQGGSVWAHVWHLCVASTGIRLQLEFHFQFRITTPVPKTCLFAFPIWSTFFRLCMRIPLYTPATKYRLYASRCVFGLVCLHAICRCMLHSCFDGMFTIFLIRKHPYCR